ncbi:MAG: hypothetical protein ACQEQX_05215 [Thermodesulfobacteriota bacterium]
MQLHCEHCGKDFDLPREKLPSGERFGFTCPVCKGRNQVDLSVSRAGTQEQAEPESEVRTRKVEPDLFPPGAWTAFCFVQDGTWQQALQEVLQQWEYYQSSAQDPGEAVQKLRLNSYDLIAIQDEPQAEPLLQEVGTWPGAVRREINVLLLGPGGPSFDPGLAFSRGVNAYLSLQDKDRARELLQQAREHFRHFILPWEMARDKREQSKDGAEDGQAQVQAGS